MCSGVLILSKTRPARTSFGTTCDTSSSPKKMWGAAFEGLEQKTNSKWAGWSACRTTIDMSWHVLQSVQKHAWVCLKAPMLPSTCGFKISSLYFFGVFGHSTAANAAALPAGVALCDRIGWRTPPTRGRTLSLGPLATSGESTVMETCFVIFCILYALDTQISHAASADISSIYSVELSVRRSDNLIGHIIDPGDWHGTGHSHGVRVFGRNQNIEFQNNYYWHSLDNVPMRIYQVGTSEHTLSSL